jgi:hypothetical protein
MKRYRLKGCYDEHLVEDGTPLDWLLALAPDQAVVEWEYERERGTSATITTVTVRFPDIQCEILFLVRYNDWVTEIDDV